jgi:hypothetical protein
MPSRIVTLDNNGNAYVPLAGIPTLVFIKNLSSSQLSVNIAGSQSFIDAGNGREWSGYELADWNGYFEITNGTPNGQLEVYYETEAYKPSALKKLFGRL